MGITCCAETKNNKEKNGEEMKKESINSKNNSNASITKEMKGNKKNNYENENQIEQMSEIKISINQVNNKIDETAEKTKQKKIEKNKEEIINDNSNDLNNNIIINNINDKDDININNNIKDNNNNNINKENISNNSKDNLNNNSKENNNELIQDKKDEENLPSPQSVINNSSKKEGTQFFTNEGTKIKENNNNNENDGNEKNKYNNNHYETLEAEKELYLICPECHSNIIRIESVLYQEESKEFLVSYKCLCREPAQKYFYNIISKDKTFCDFHRYPNIKICEDCEKLLCKDCSNEHKEHKINLIINKDIISEEIMQKIKEKKEEFKGINILQNLFDFYHYEKIIEQELINQGELKYKEVQNSLKYINNYKPGTIISKPQEEIMNYKNTKTIQAHNERISSLTKLQNDMIATGSYDGKVKIWDISKEEKDALVMVKNAIGTVFCLLEFEPDKLLGGTSANMVNLWDLSDKNNQEYIHNFYQHYLWVHALVKCDEDHFASASNDTKIIIWNYRNQKSEKILEGHSDCIMDMIMLQSGYLCTASADETIRIWDWKEAKCLFSFKPHKKYVKCICELNNKLLITGSEDNTIGICKEKEKPQEYENIKLLEGHTYPVRSLCQLDDKHFVSGSFDNKIKIWNLDKFECIQTLEGHKSNVISVIKYKDDILISCSNDKTIKIWENIKI